MLIIFVPLLVFIKELSPLTVILLLPFPTFIVADTFDVMIFSPRDEFTSTLSPEFIIMLSLPFPVFIFMVPFPLMIKLSFWSFFASNVKFPPSMVKVLFVVSYV